MSIIKTKNKILIIVLTSILAVSITCCSKGSQTKLADNHDVKYTLYIGLNDKDSYMQEIKTEDAVKKVTDIALKYVDGFTQVSAKGAYKDDEGVITYENSLVFSFYFANDQQMKSIMDEVLVELNQNSILIEKEIVNYEFYEGDKQ